LQGEGHYDFFVYDPSLAHPHLSFGNVREKHATRSLSSLECAGDGQNQPSEDDGLEDFTSWVCCIDHTSHFSYVACIQDFKSKLFGSVHHLLMIICSVFVVVKTGK
jgi:hypothetical protein